MKINRIIGAVALTGLALALTGCRPLESMPYSPTRTPEDWLRIQPFVEVHLGPTAILVVQPTTTAIVYVLGIVAIGAGVHVLRRRDGHRSRLWWGIALPLWGIGALLAGTSYEAFSYQIKCAGRAACLWTSWWEIGYLAVSAASVDAILIAQAHACAAARWRAATSCSAWPRRAWASASAPRCWPRPASPRWRASPSPTRPRGAAAAARCGC